MNGPLFLAFVLATIVLAAMPGPTVMLITALGLRSGARAGLMAVTGSTLAAAIHVAVVVAGLASILAFLRDWFGLLRWIGVAYLVYLGVRSLLRPPRSGRLPNAGARDSTALVQGFIVTFTNPKTLLFIGAWFPQFVDPSLPEFPQLSVLAVTFVLLLALLDAAWVLLAIQAGARIRKLGSRRLIERGAAALLLGAAAAAALSRRP